MARDFTAGSSENLRVNSSPITAYPFSISLWFYADNGANTCSLCWIGDKDVSNEYQGLRIGSDEVIAAYSRNSSTFPAAFSSAAATLNTWQHAAGVFASASSRAAYLNGGNKGTETTSVTINNTYDRVTIGNQDDSTPNDYMDGRIAMVGIWSAALTDADVAVLGAGYSPLFVKPESLAIYLPIVGKYSPEIDLVGGLNFTVTGTSAVPQPAVRVPSMKQPFYKAAAAAATGPRFFGDQGLIVGGF